MRDQSALSRRAFLLSAAAIAAVPAAATEPPVARDALTDLSAAEAVRRMAQGELSVERYARALLERCQAGAALNAFITLEPQRVLEAARECDRLRRSGAALGPLFGLPIPVKDSVITRDYPTTAGTPALRHFRPSEDAPTVQALRSAGAIVLGKTNLHELSWGWTSNNLAFGAVHNPYDRSRIPGGSSGGTAAAVASRMAPLGIAEDTEGSIRVPAALCGIVGFRPTIGRYSTEGCAPISALFDQLGPHARTVADIGLFDRVLTRDLRPLQAKALHGVRLGVVHDYWYTDLDPEVERITRAALERLRQAGVELVESELPGLSHLIDLTTSQVQTHDVRLTLTRFLRRYHAPVSFEELVSQASPDIQQSFRSDVLPGSPHAVSDASYAQIVATHLPALRRLMHDYFGRTGAAALVFPCTRVPALPIGSEADVMIAGRKVSFARAIARNIDPGSTAGIPGLVLPAGMTASGLPVALELDAPAGSDRALLELGISIAELLGPSPPPRLA